MLSMLFELRSRIIKSRFNFYFISVDVLFFVIQSFTLIACLAIVTTIGSTVQCACAEFKASLRDCLGSTITTLGNKVVQKRKRLDFQTNMALALPDLPDEILNHIFQFLSPVVLHKTVSLVCKHWLKLIRNGLRHLKVTRSLYMKYFGLPWNFIYGIKISDDRLNIMMQKYLKIWP